MQLALLCGGNYNMTRVLLAEGSIINEQEFNYPTDRSCYRIWPFLIFMASIQKHHKDRLGHPGSWCFGSDRILSRA